MDFNSMSVIAKKFGGELIAHKTVNKYGYRHYDTYKYEFRFPDDTPIPPKEPLYVNFTFPTPRYGSVARVDLVTLRKDLSDFITYNSIDIKFVWDDIAPVKTYEKNSIDLPSYTMKIDHNATQTKWVWNIEKKEKVDNPPKINMYGQTLEKDAMVIAQAGRSAKNSRLYVGRISRWTESNIWMKPIRLHARDTAKECMIQNYECSIVINNEEQFNEELLFLKMAAG